MAGMVPAERRPEFLRAISLVMGQKRQLSWDLPAVDTFEFNRVVFDIDARDYRRRLDELVSLLAVGEVMRRPVRNLSLGERMKCELVAALLHAPRILFLDEPTIGMDVAMQLAIREFVRRYNVEHGATVILTSHYMEDVAALCPRGTGWSAPRSPTAPCRGRATARTDTPRRSARTPGWRRRFGR